MDENRKNVIFIVADALRQDRLSIRGYRRKGERTTPNIDELAKEGRFFTRAYSPGPWTPVSQPSILTGEYASNLDWARGGKKLPERHKTIAEVFKQRGYETRGYNMSMYIRSDLGFDRGFDYYEDIPLKDRFELDFWHLEGMFWNLIFGRDSRTRYAQKSIKRWIGSRDDEKPFFLFWNPTNPHNKYEAPREFRKKFERDIEPGMNEEGIEDVAGWGNSLGYVVGDFDLSDEEMDVVESRYDAEVAYLDYRIGELIDFLKEEDLYEDTIIVFTSDHGENFADIDRLLYHDVALNEALIRVPLIIKGEAFGKDEVDVPVSTVDIFNSVIKASTGDILEGIESDKTLLPGETAREVVFSERADFADSSYIKKLEERSPPKPIRWYSRGLKAAIKGNKKLILDSDGKIETYDVSEGQEVEETFSEEVRDNLLLEIDNKLGDFHKEEDEETDERVKERLRKLGYI